MTREDFISYRKRLGKTQKQIAELLGTSIKAIHSYEQGWRAIPTHVERQIIFLLSRKRPRRAVLKPCWLVKKCPPSRRKACPAWEFQAGKLCWFINGTICECKARKSWAKKMEICRSCPVITAILGEETTGEQSVEESRTSAPTSATRKRGGATTKRSMV